MLMSHQTDTPAPNMIGEEAFIKGLRHIVWTRLVVLKDRLVVLKDPLGAITLCLLVMVHTIHVELNKSSLFSDIS